MKKLIILKSLCALSCAAAGAGYPIAMPRMGSVRPTGGFWAAREAANRLVTAMANLKHWNSQGVLAKASHCWRLDTVDALFPGLSSGMLEMRVGRR